MIALLLLLHGALGLSAVVVSVLCVQARRSDRTQRLGAWLVAVVGAQVSVGAVLYPFYLRRAKPALLGLVAGGRSAADIFEVKEHLAFIALACALGAYVVTRSEPKPDLFVRTLFGCAHGAIIIVAVLGLVVASLRLP